jgi:hypothetical protein
MVGLAEGSQKKDTSSKTQSQLIELREAGEANRQRILRECADKPKYSKDKSTNDPKRFRRYLQSRVHKWESLSDKGGHGTTHAKRMLEKTNSLITIFSNYE